MDENQQLDDKRKISYSPNKKNKREKKSIKRVKENKKTNNNNRFNSKERSDLFLSKTNQNSFDKKHHHKKEIKDIFHFRKERNNKEKINGFPDFAKNSKNLKFKMKTSNRQLDKSQKKTLCKKNSNLPKKKKPNPDKKIVEEEKKNIEKVDCIDFCINHQNKLSKFLLELTELHNKKIGFCLECGYDLKNKGFILKDKMSKEDSRYFNEVNDLNDKVKKDIIRFEMLKTKITNHEIYIKEIFNNQKNKIISFFQKIIDLFLLKKKILLDNFLFDFENEKNCLNGFKNLVVKNLQDFNLIKEKLETKESNFDLKTIENNIKQAENLYHYKFHKFEIFPNINPSSFCKYLNKYYEKLWRNLCNNKKAKLNELKNKNKICLKQNPIRGYFNKSQNLFKTLKEKEDTIVAFQDYKTNQQLGIWKRISMKNENTQFQLSEKFISTPSNNKNCIKIEQSDNQNLSIKKEKKIKSELHFKSKKKRPRTDSKKILAENEGLFKIIREDEFDKEKDIIVEYNNTGIYQSYEDNNLSKRNLFKNLRRSLEFLEDLKPLNASLQNKHLFHQDEHYNFANDKKNEFSIISYIKEIEDLQNNSESKKKITFKSFSSDHNDQKINYSNFNYSDIKSKIHILTTNLLKGNIIDKNS